MSLISSTRIAAFQIPQFSHPQKSKYLTKINQLNVFVQYNFQNFQQNPTTSFLWKIVTFFKQEQVFLRTDVGLYHLFWLGQSLIYSRAISIPPNPKISNGKYSTRLYLINLLISFPKKRKRKSFGCLWSCCNLSF